MTKLGSFFPQYPLEGFAGFERKILKISSFSTHLTETGEVVRFFGNFFLPLPTGEKWAVWPKRSETFSLQCPLDSSGLFERKTGETVTASVDDIVALARFDKPIYAGLKEIGRVERGGDKPYHVVINGENYHALQTLVYAYQGQVDCIYIDPPYNTGATDWKYNNNYVGKDDKYRHSKWLTFMEDRLRLAKKLLNPKDSMKK